MHVIIGILFLLFFYGSLGIIQYYVCPHDVMPDKDRGGFMVVQFAFSFVVTFWLFPFFTDLYDLENRFGDKDWQRIIFVLCLAFISFFILGLLIEGFLILTHKAYRKWRFNKET